MAESTTDKIKFRILKALDVSGFTVFDPVVRLCFGEDPKKQMESISKYIIVPVFFMLACLTVWWWMGPRHKTKSGEVPTPDIVWDSVKINDTIAERENIKKDDFLLSGDERLERLAVVKSHYSDLETEVAEAKAAVAAAEAEKAAHQEARIAPLQGKYDELRSTSRSASKERDAHIKTLSEQVATGETHKAQLLEALRADDKQTNAERDALKLLKADIDEVRSDKSSDLVRARKQFDSLSDELLFLNTRIEILSGRNLSVKLAEAKTDLDENIASLSSAEDGKAALVAAKKTIRAEEGIERLGTQDYASAVTIYHQIRRSLFTVFIGFFMAAVVAIPVGIMCGLKKVLMA